MVRQTWFITGAGRGLGRALAEQALAAGHTVVAAVRGDHSLQPHDRLLVQQLDVRDRTKANLAVEHAVQRTGRLDVLINNAGYGLVGAVEEVGEEDARAILDTNLLGALWLSQAAVRTMRRQGAGHIVQISTVGALGAMPTLGLYNASKWGLEGFSEALAAEVAPFGIRVTIVEPGGLDTGWATSSMRFSKPVAAYDDLRRSLFGTSAVPWPVEPGATGGGTSPSEAAAAVIRYVHHPDDGRLRLLIGEDAAEQVATVLRRRQQDYGQLPPPDTPGNPR
ncbi:SDR family NAD(P)-dependent oxidoreductase [Arthrobacter sp. zg-Y1219]|uniref:SDR family NAD(P)-dependent oxidoreductase n=1 Tax=Arthrobacter sp. zg-Y1219 TaxID=3049067 RepID=UPI0024C3A8FF|nr:SDR family NAD(P)-dependent oxidoreductase [Arthrobacter sp. zg-Y1219]MDK1358923.1 SDR family NAD(P)-dependent oxidoreductase [Arthrobacter sp. zg-Y1219]